MDILVIGGSVFLGRAIVSDALRRGDTVTTFNRGITGVDLPGAEAVRGDRTVTADLERLAEGRRWDAVVDVCGFVPRVVGDSARILSSHADAYVFISSISAFRDWPARRVDESSATYECGPDAGPDDGDYGELKAGCERAVQEGFDGRVLLLNPGLILGPHENVGRLPWWLRRIAGGGTVLAPGDPSVEMQVIDARDIATFGHELLHGGTEGRFLVTGPPGNTTFGRWLADCVAVTGSDAELVWVPDEVLVDHGVEKWTELPLWLPVDAETAATWQASVDTALAARLTCRPVADTVRDTWSWMVAEGVDTLPSYRDMPDLGMEPAKEKEILAAWTASGG
jgi:2'-hydroxyisoflavone reductase